MSSTPERPSPSAGESFPSNIVPTGTVSVWLPQLYYSTVEEEGEVEYFPGYIIFYPTHVQCAPDPRIFSYQGTQQRRGTGYFSPIPSFDSRNRYQLMPLTDNSLRTPQSSNLRPLYLTEVATYVLMNFEATPGIISCPQASPSGGNQNTAVLQGEQSFAGVLETEDGVQTCPSSVQEMTTVDVSKISLHQSQLGGPSSAPGEVMSSHSCRVQEGKCGGEKSEKQNEQFEGEFGEETTKKQDEQFKDECCGETKEKQNQQYGHECGGETTEKQEQEFEGECGGDTTGKQDHQFEGACSGDTTKKQDEQFEDECGGETTEKQDQQFEGECGGETTEKQDRQFESECGGETTEKQEHQFEGERGRETTENQDQQLEGECDDQSNAVLQNFLVDFDPDQWPSL